MSLLWNSPFRITRGSGDNITLVGSADYFIKTKCDLIPRADFCPCTRWWIVSLCPCTACGYHSNSKSLGPRASFPANYPTSPYAEHDAAGMQMYDEDGNMIHKITFTRGDWPGCATDGYLGDGISCVEHQTSPAPFDGTIKAILYLNGVAISTHADIDCAQNDQFWLGCDTFYTSPDPNTRDNLQSNAWFIMRDIPEKGSHKLDLVIRFEPDDPDLKPQGYAMRMPIRIHSMPTGSSYGKVMVIPDWALSENDECGVHGLVGNDVVSFYMEPLKGPFDSEADAKNVYARWKSLLDEYAATCACQTHGCLPAPDGFGFGWWHDDPSENGLYQLDSFANGPEPSFGCLSEYVSYAVSIGSHIVLLKTLESGQVFPALPSGILAPCERIDAWATSKPDWNDPDFNAKWGIGEVGDGIHAVGDERPPCRFCENSAFLQSPVPADCAFHLESYDADGLFWLSGWHYTPTNQGGPAGIPSTTQELLDYLGDVLMVRASDILLSELPEGLA